MYESTIDASVPLYKDVAEAVQEGIDEDDLIPLEDGGYTATDFAAYCDGCGTAFADPYELDEDDLCETCSREAAHFADHDRSLRASYHGSRGVRSGRSGGW